MHVQIVMGTWNSERYLSEQLQSFSQQQHTDWSLWVSDDGSGDRTRDIVRDYAQSVPQDVHLSDGPGKGVAANFLSLLCSTDLKPGAVAMADHDDVWLPNKLTRALEALAGQDEKQPTLYCTGSHIVDADLQELHLSPPRPRPPSFRNALLQTIAGGNTMVLNAAALALVQTAGPEVEVPFHDWWLYLLISGAGGTVIYDEEPSLLYRQHQSNMRGQNRGLAARYDRLSELLDSRYKHWIDSNLTALADCVSLLTKDTLEVFEDFVACREMQGVAAARLARRLSIYRQSWLETQIILFALAAGRA
jgi:glycosyltransferase involved in cell wall biosynthesis